MNEIESLLRSLLAPAAPLDPHIAHKLVLEYYGIEANATRLTGERDENFWMRSAEGPGYVFKVANPGEPLEITDLQVAALLHLERVDPSIPCPRVIRSRQNTTLVRFSRGDGLTRTAVLYTFLPGTTLFCAARSLPQRLACGRLAARLGQALRSFTHVASERAILWDLRRLPDLLGLLPQVPDLPYAEFCSHFLARFSSDIAPRLDSLRRQFVHNDFNARNILVDADDETRITGIIDFGDSVHTSLIADVAVGVIGQLACPETADPSIQDFVRAYSEVEPLSREELQILPWLIAGRIVQNVVMTSWHRSHESAGSHFDGFDTNYFGWRIELAQRLVSGATILPNS